jgi:hypothetical protein
VKVQAKPGYRGERLIKFYITNFVEELGDADW